MEQEKTLTSQIKNRKRIDITPSNYLSKFKLLIVCILLVSIIFDVYLILCFRISFLTIGLMLITTVPAIMVTILLKKSAKATSLKGDTIIFNSLDNKSSVTSIRSIRKIRSKTALGIQWTRLSYMLDGVPRSAVILNRIANSRMNPELTLRKALEINKKKANHKPGPVAAN